MKKKISVFILLWLIVVGFNISAANGQTATVENTIPSYSRAALPAPGRAGRIARVTDEERGLYVDTGTDWVSLAGNEIDVRLFGAKGDAVTDDTNAIQQAINFAASGGRGGVVTFPPPKKYYLVGGRLNLDEAKYVTLQGAGGLTSFAARDGAVVFTAGGAAALVSARSSFNVKIRNLRFIYTSADFTGDLIDFSGILNTNTPADPYDVKVDTHYPEVSGCELRGDIYTNERGASVEAVNARSLIRLNAAIIATVRNTQFTWANVGVLGRTDPVYSNSVTVEGCTFLRLKTVGVKNAHEQWRIVGNTFEPTIDGQAGAYDEDMGSFGPVIFEKNWCGDVSKPGKPWIRYTGQNLVVRNNMLGSAGAGQAAIEIHTTNRTVEMIVMDNNEYVNLAGVAVRVTGTNGSLRVFNAYNEQFVPHSSQTYLQVDASTQILFKTILGNDANLGNEIGAVNIGGAFNASYIPNIAAITDKPFAVIGQLDYSIGKTHNTLGIVGKTRSGDNHGGVEIWTGNTTPQRRLRVDEYAVTSEMPLVAPSLKVDGKNGASLNGVYSAAARLVFPIVVAGSTTELTMTVTGAQPGDAVTVTPSTAPEAGLVWSGYVSATNTITIRLANVTAAPIRPAPRDWRTAVLKF